MAERVQGRNAIQPDYNLFSYFIDYSTFVLKNQEVLQKKFDIFGDILYIFSIKYLTKRVLSAILVK